MTEGEELVLLELDNDLIYKQLQKLELLQAGSEIEWKVRREREIAERITNSARKLKLKLVIYHLLRQENRLWEVFTFGIKVI